MKILAIADQESPYLWDHFEPHKLEGIDLILSCGDLNPLYLSFLATFAHGPVLYVHGNHDDRYSHTPPDGCICIENKIFTYKGVRILGLGGSMRYKPGPHQYSQSEMNLRILKLLPQLRRHRGFDILMTHAPAYQITDQPDLPHQGFKGFVKLLDQYSPGYMVHGHVHLTYGYQVKRRESYRATTIINAYERTIFEL
ncbi:MAG: metallophosphoesterase [Lachnospiraceae bacterium]|jgi:Icc-related predicted phosphoesterase|nr:metallophosphoesterase [Lachnospiraceae bacterium]